jgi:signal peptidase I
MDDIEEKSFAASVIETVKTVVYALLIAGVFRTLFFQPFWIPSGSMKDSLLIGDFLFVNKMAYGYSYASCPKIQIASLGLNIDADDFCGFIEDRDTRILGGAPERGDVVVFRHPVTGADYIKRLVGLPGDKIQMQGGVLQINGTPVARSQVDDFVETFDQDSMRLGGRMNLDTTKVYTVPDGHFFFMGDNRDNSSDSRVPQTIGGVGFVPLKDIVGRADRILFSSAGASILAFWTWRSDRYFKAID